MEHKIITVEVYADIICPWCYVGKKRLQKAFASRPNVTPNYIWRAFLLNPRMNEEGMDRQTYLDHKFGIAKDTIYKKIETAGLETGINFNFDKITRTPDSRSVHHLLLTVQNNLDTLSDAFYEAYFIHGKDISDPKVHNEIIKENKVDVDYNALKSPSTKKQLEQDLFMARQFKIDSVPYFIFAEQYAVAGAHMPEHFLPVIDAAAAL